MAPSLAEAVSVVWLPYVIARVIVGLSLALSRYEVSHLKIGDLKAVTASHAGLTGSDASWYSAIATDGYHGVAHQGLRFFPLYPSLLNTAHHLTGASVGSISVLLANVLSFLAVMGIYLLTRFELGDRVVARRAAWLLCLTPASFVLVMGYAESLFLVLAIGAFYGLRRRMWWLATFCGVLAGLTRPIGMLLALPALVELIRSWSGAKRLDRVAQVSAVAAPVLGAAVYLAWVAHAFGGFFEPFRIQMNGSRHGGIGDPVSVLYHAALDALHGHVGTALHVPWIVLAALLVVVAFWRLPVSYGLFAAVVIAAALSGQNLDSFERYALSAFPVVIAAATLIKSERVALPVITLSAVAMFAYGLLAFLGAYVP